jgi:hypothetical protein
MFEQQPDQTVSLGKKNHDSGFEGCASESSDEEEEVHDCSLLDYFELPAYLRRPVDFNQEVAAKLSLLEESKD